MEYMELPDMLWNPLVIGAASSAVTVGYRNYNFGNGISDRGDLVLRLTMRTNTGSDGRRVEVLVGPEQASGNAVSETYVVGTATVVGNPTTHVLEIPINQNLDKLTGKKSIYLRFPDGAGVSSGMEINTIQFAKIDQAYITGISVNGQPIEDFARNKTSYDVELPFGSGIPVITYEDDGSMFDIEMQVPSTLPGTVTITVISVEDTQSTDYAIMTYTVKLNKAPLDISILLDGSLLPGFNHMVLNYTLKKPIGNTPNTAVDEKSNVGLNVQITEATDENDTIVTVVISKGIESVTYTITFQAPSASTGPKSDDFTTGSMKPFWYIFAGRENTANYSLNENGLRIRSTNTDFDTTTNNAQNVFMQNVDDSDWDISTQFTMNRLPLSASYAGAQLVAMQDEDNFVKVAFTGNNNTTAPRVQIVSETNGTRSEVNMSLTAGAVQATDTVSLRLTRMGNVYTGYYKTNNGNWIQIVSGSNTNRTKTMTNIKVGIGAFGWSASSNYSTSPFDVIFKNFVVEGDEGNQSIQFTDAAGKTVLSALTKNTLRVKQPYVGNGKKLIMFVGIYDGNQKLVQISSQEKNTPKWADDEFDVILNLPENTDGHFATSGYKAIVFIWESDTFIPVVQQVIFPS